jgi:hypothetical protein
MLRRTKWNSSAAPIYLLYLRRRLIAARTAVKPPLLSFRVDRQHACTPRVARPTDDATAVNAFVCCDAMCTFLYKIHAGAMLMTETLTMA